MLIASYLLGYDDKGALSHLAVDKLLSECADSFSFELRARHTAQNGARDQYDLVMLFPQREAPFNLICLPELPAIVVDALYAGVAIPIIDLSGSGAVSVELMSEYNRLCA